MIRPIQWLSNSSDQAGMFIAVGTVAATFQQTLMPRNNADQAVLTGLSMALSYQIASLVNDGIDALATAVLAVRSSPAVGRRAENHRGAVPGQRDERHRHDAQRVARLLGDDHPRPDEADRVGGHHAGVRLPLPTRRGRLAGDP